MKSVLINKCIAVKVIDILLHLHPEKRKCPGVGIGRQAWLRAMCPYGRAGSSPVPGTKTE